MDWINGFPGGIIGGIVAALIVGVMKPYFRRKAENYATHEDIQMLIAQVKETETVKAEIADRMWDRQARWNAKREGVEKLVIQLTKVLTFCAEIGGKEYDQGTLGALNEMKAHANSLATDVNLSRLYLSQAGIDAFLKVTEQFGHIMNAGLEVPKPDVTPQLAAYRERMSEFIELAKAELNLSSKVPGIEA